MRGRVSVVATAVLFALGGGTEAGELVFKNGQRLPAELTNRALVVSTGTDLIELDPERITLLRSGEIRTTDGRTIRGTLVGREIRARTALGELTVAVDELAEYRAGTLAAPATDAAAEVAPSPLAPATMPGGPEPGPEGPSASRGLWDRSMDVARGITEGVNRVQAGVAAAGRTLREGMFSAARAVRQVFPD
jgi:hypothetical protein